MIRPVRLLTGPCAKLDLMNLLTSDLRTSLHHVWKDKRTSFVLHTSLSARVCLMSFKPHAAFSVHTTWGSKSAGTRPLRSKDGEIQELILAGCFRPLRCSSWIRRETQIEESRLEMRHERWKLGHLLRFWGKTLAADECPACPQPVCDVENAVIFRVMSSMRRTSWRWAAHSIHPLHHIPEVPPEMLREYFTNLTNNWYY